MRMDSFWSIKFQMLLYTARAAKPVGGLTSMAYKIHISVGLWRLSA